ncbi:MAG: glycerol-3-phosphate dehydrogenase [Alphaproteobacteria bacterium]|nr:MAG: glycerol-3-phosphate dehydrogenase [Alphaproteobacteria bacterium]
MSRAYDLVVIGGGVNGAGIARDAAGRGLRVLLVEAGDLATATSSASSKLIHGGLRYLRYGEFSLVREALAERRRLLCHAPHIVWPQRILLPAGERGSPPAFLLRAGLFLYDHLAPHEPLPASRRLRREPEAAAFLKKPAKRLFAYWDGATHDARLVVLIARDAAEHGAEIRLHTRFLEAHRRADCWDVVIESQGRRETVSSRVLVNATGPWVDAINRRIFPVSPRRASGHLTLVQGSHIVVPRLYPGDDGFLLPQPDGRIVFVLPFGRRHHLVGTTETAFSGDPGTARPRAEEISYLLAALARHFARPPGEEDIRHAFAGVRPLYDPKARSMTAASRHYVLDLEAEHPTGPALLVVYGGKLTSFRALAEKAVDQLAGRLPRIGPAWTADAPLPGGEGLSGPSGFRAFLEELAHRFPFLAPEERWRLAHAYGTRLVSEVLAGVSSRADLGADFGHGLTARELDHLIGREWVTAADDVLWRRSLLGLSFTPAERERLEQAIASRRAQASSQEASAPA